MLLNVGSVVRNYKIISGMKHGAQVLVFLVNEIKTQKQFVLKSMFVETSRKADFEKMINNWKSLCLSKAKDSIVSYVEHFYEGENAIIIMEYCIKGNLEDLIKQKTKQNEKFTESEVVKALVDLMSLLHAMISIDFVHGDIKSTNIMIGADGKYKLSVPTSKILEGIVETLEFTAPEIVNAERFSHPADVYSVGVVLYQMMVGKLPFVNDPAVPMNLKYTPIAAPLEYSAALVAVVHTCLSRNPAGRPMPAQVLASELVGAQALASDGVLNVCKEILFSKEQIAAKVAELGAILSQQYRGKRPVLVGVLRGGFIFAGDIARSLTCECEIDFIRIASYAGLSSTGDVQVKLDVGDIKGREVLVCEDIVDSGRSLSFLLKYLKTKEPKTVTTVCLLDKKSKRARGFEHVNADLVGWEIPDVFVIGCGLDYNGLYRNLPYVGVIDPKFI